MYSNPFDIKKEEMMPFILPVYKSINTTRPYEIVTDHNCSFTLKEFFTLPEYKNKQLYVQGWSFINQGKTLSHECGILSYTAFNDKNGRTYIMNNGSIIHVTFYNDNTITFNFLHEFSGHYSYYITG